MKAYKILFFILSVIAALLVICLFFPSDGIRVGSMTLRFPPIEQILTQNTEQDTIDVDSKLEKLETAMPVEENEGLKDSIAYYKEFVTSHPTRFYLPNQDYTYFDSFFQSLEQAEDKQKVIRVLHYGDSQIELDRISSDLRDFFQSKFGGCGPGLLPIVQSIPTFSVNTSSSGNLVSYACYGESNYSPKRDYGLMAKYYRMNGSATFSASKSNQKEAKEAVKRFSRIKLLFTNHEGTFKAVLNDRKTNSKYERETDRKGMQTMEWKLQDPSTSVSLSLNGNANIYGIFLDGHHGVNVDNIPLRGSSGLIFTRTDSTVLRNSYQLIDAGLIILQFGGNAMAGIKGPKNIESFKGKISAEINYLKRVYPEAKMLFIGPADMSTKIAGKMQSYPHIRAFSTALCEAANENGIAYWDMFDVMGGENSMIAWVNHSPPLAGKDYIHFTHSGANKIGELISNSFLIMHDFHLLRLRTGEEKANDLWKEITKEQ